MSTIKRLLGFAGPYWKVYTATFVLILCITGTQLLQPMIARFIVDKVYAEGKWSLLIWGAAGIARASP